MMGIISYIIHVRYYVITIDYVNVMHGIITLLIYIYNYITNINIIILHMNIYNNKIALLIYYIASLGLIFTYKMERG